jgi:hypothetical protein
MLHPLVNHPVVRGVVISVLGALVTKALLPEDAKTRRNWPETGTGNRPRPAGTH